MQYFVNRQPSCSEKMVRFPKKKSFSRDQRGLGRHRVLLHAQRKSEFTAARHAVLSLKGYRETGNVRSDQVQHVLKKSFNTKSCVLIGRKCLSEYGAVPGDLRAPGMGLAMGGAGLFCTAHQAPGWVLFLCDLAEPTHPSSKDFTNITWSPTLQVKKTGPERLASCPSRSR